MADTYMATGQLLVVIQVLYNKHDMCQESSDFQTTSACYSIVWLPHLACSEEVSLASRGVMNNWYKPFVLM